MADGTNTQTCKQAAVDFLQLITAGRIDEAYEKHVDMQGKHHNPFFAAGFPSLMKAMIENHVQFPNKQMMVKNALGDGDVVAVHSHIVPSPGQTGIAAVHLFRFHGDKIVELWDIGEPMPADSPNRDGVFLERSIQQDRCVHESDARRGHAGAGAARRGHAWRLHTRRLGNALRRSGNG